MTTADDPAGGNPDAARFLAAMNTSPQYNDGILHARRTWLQDTVGLTGNETVPARFGRVPPGAARELQGAHYNLLEGNLGSAVHLLGHAAASARARGKDLAADTITAARTVIAAAADNPAPGVPPGLGITRRPEHGADGTVTVHVVASTGRHLQIRFRDGMIHAGMHDGKPGTERYGPTIGIDAPAGPDPARRARELAGLLTGSYDAGNTILAGHAAETRDLAFTLRCAAPPGQDTDTAAGQVTAAAAHLDTGYRDSAAAALAAALEWLDAVAGEDRDRGRSSWTRLTGGDDYVVDARMLSERTWHLRQRILRAAGRGDSPARDTRELAADIEEAGWRTGPDQTDGTACSMLTAAAGQLTGNAPAAARALLAAAATWSSRHAVRLSGGQLAAPVITGLITRLDELTPPPPGDLAGQALAAAAWLRSQPRTVPGWPSVSRDSQARHLEEAASCLTARDRSGARRAFERAAWPFEARLSFGSPPDPGDALAAALLEQHNAFPARPQVPAGSEPRIRLQTARPNGTLDWYTVAGHDRADALASQIREKGRAVVTGTAPDPATVTPEILEFLGFCGKHGYNTAYSAGPARNGSGAVEETAAAFYPGTPHRDYTWKDGVLQHLDYGDAITRAADPRAMIGRDMDMAAQMPYLPAAATPPGTAVSPVKPQAAAPARTAGSRQRPAGTRGASTIGPR
jgi:hypothetical protein